MDGLAASFQKENASADWKEAINAFVVVPVR